MLSSDDDLSRALAHLPAVPLPFDGNAAQAAGLDLPIAVINLPHRTDRWEAVLRRMAAVGLDRLIRVPAVVGATLSLPDIAPLLAQPAAQIEAPPAGHFSLTRPAIGCFLSHLAVWQWAIRNAIPRVLVLEDDANPVAGFDAGRLRAALAAVPQDAGIIFLGRLIMHGMGDRLVAGAPFARLYFFNGTFAYVITPAAARTLMRHLLPMNGHIDHETSMVLVKLRQELAAYSAEPPFFEPDWSLRSDCFVPLAEEDQSNRALGALLDAQRQLLLDDGRPLLPPAG